MSHVSRGTADAHNGAVPCETSMSVRPELRQLSQWLGLAWSEQQRSSLALYEKWLVEEAIPAGGIGPRERRRIFDRHIADSLAFLRFIEGDAATLIDVGTGVGLPAIPIAIARPDIEVLAIDRSSRRASLASRAVRILGLANVCVSTCDVREVTDRFDVMTLRASLEIQTAALAFLDLVAKGGVGLLALSRTRERDALPDPPPGIIFTVEMEGDGVLDSPAWFLRMTQSRTQ